MKYEEIIEKIIGDKIGKTDKSIYRNGLPKINYIDKINYDIYTRQNKLKKNINS